jgi:hypothetical protein
MSSYAGNGLRFRLFSLLWRPVLVVGEPAAAFPGINPNVGANQMLFPSGRAEYNGLQLSLKQDSRLPPATFGP